MSDFCQDGLSISKISGTFQMLMQGIGIVSLIHYLMIFYHFDPNFSQDPCDHFVKLMSDFSFTNLKSALSMYWQFPDGDTWELVKYR